MKAMVVYDSFFGNTEQIARVVAEGLGSGAEVSLLKVGDARPEQVQGLDLLVVGSPTRGFRPTKPVAAFLEAVSLQGLRCAAFDTRLLARDIHSWVLVILEKMFGWAAEPIGKGLKKAGGQLVLPPEGFIVMASEGPLKEGELERVAEWARQLLERS